MRNPVTESRIGLLVLVLCGLFCISCSPSSTERQPSDDPKGPILVIAIDGLEWSVLETLFDQGQLPNLKQLADTGYSTNLETAFDASPVIWTTIATGVHPTVHGITDFVVPSASGDRPVDSTTRKVPALWNMASQYGVETGFYGWWATWPAEEIEGELVSDLALDESRSTAHPEALQSALQRIIEAALADDTLDLPVDGVGARDRVMVSSALRSLENNQFPLTAVYFRFLDLQSHYFWRLYQPDVFGGAANQEFDDPVSKIYRQVDTSVGRLLDAAAPGTNVVVLSDHGFRPLKEEEARIQLDLDRLLEEVGLLVKKGDQIDTEGSKLYSFDSRPTRELKWLRFGSATTDDERAAALRQLESLATELSWSAEGDSAIEPVFRLRPTKVREKERGIDLSLRVLPPERALQAIEAVTTSWSAQLYLRGQRLKTEVQISRLSGGHSRSTHGVLITNGPAFDANASVDRVRIHDIAPTLLYALGLPVAEDFIGEAKLGLFSQELREQRSLEVIESWGQRSSLSVPSESDESQLEQLRSLGYIE